MSCTLTQEKLDLFKAQFPENAKIQAVTLDEVIENTTGKADWKSLPIRPAAPVLAASALSCGVATGFVIYDAVALFLGAGATRDGVTAGEAEAVAEAAKPVLSQLEGYIKTIKEGGSVTETAAAVFGIIKTIYNGGCIGAVVSAFLGTLSFWNMILYGATALASIVAAVATDGAAEIAEIALELATAGWLVSDSVAAAEACDY